MLVSLATFASENKDIYAQKEDGQDYFEKFMNRGLDPDHRERKDDHCGAENLRPDVDDFPFIPVANGLTGIRKLQEPAMEAW